MKWKWILWCYGYWIINIIFMIYKKSLFFAEFLLFIYCVLLQIGFDSCYPYSTGLLHKTAEVPKPHSVVRCPVALQHSWIYHNSDVIISAMASQITSITIVCSFAYSGAEQRKHQSSASLAFVQGIHWNSPLKGLAIQKMFPFDDMIMAWYFIQHSNNEWQNTNGTFNWKKTPHNSPSWASYGVSVVSIFFFRKLRRVSQYKDVILPV